MSGQADHTGPSTLAALSDDAVARQRARARAGRRLAWALATAVWVLGLLAWYGPLGLGEGTAVLLAAAGLLAFVVGSRLAERQGRDEPGSSVTGFFAVLLVVHVVLALANLALGTGISEPVLVVLSVAATFAIRAARRPRSTASA